MSKVDMASSRKFIPDAPLHPYKGARAALATMHGKELVVGPALGFHLGMEIVVPPLIDTDTFGTFTGEIPRAGSMHDAALAKARLGMRLTGINVGIASEGSFGPHPAIPFIAAARELLVLIDKERNIIITEYLLTERTNFDHIIAPDDNLQPFLERIGFPSHAVIIRTNRAQGPIHKGINNTDHLASLIKEVSQASEDGKTRIETDMRAHLNPTRMEGIAQLAEKFARRLATLCPACGTPGFGIVKSESGLPCAECGAETELVKTLVSGCASCQFTGNKPRSDGLRFATAAQCPQCNP
ncbi:MAG: DUF6671 family protein [Aestuariivirga sp.]